MDGIYLDLIRKRDKIEKAQFESVITDYNSLAKHAVSLQLQNSQLKRERQLDNFPN